MFCCSHKPENPETSSVEHVNVWFLLGIQSFQYLLSVQGNLAGQELQEYPSLPSRRHFLKVHGDPAGQADLHAHTSEREGQATDHRSAVRHLSSSWGSQIGLLSKALDCSVSTFRSTKSYICLHRQRATSSQHCCNIIIDSLNKTHDWEMNV